MKNQFFKLITVLFLFILTSCGSSPSSIVSTPTPTSNTDYENIVGVPLKIGNLEVSQYTFPSTTQWIDAKKSCEALGNGWRLPTKDELNTLYQNRGTIAGFVVNRYWSSTESETDGENVWSQDFTTGGQDEVKKVINGYYFRAVRSF